MSSFQSRHRRAIIIVGVLLVLAVAAIAALPHVISRQLVNTLADMGAREATVEDVDFDPFTGRLVVDGLRFADLYGSEAKVPLFELNFDWLPLLRRHVFLQRLEVDGTHVIVELSDEPASAPARSPTEAVGKFLDILDTLSRAEWGVLGPQMDIRNFEVEFHRGDQRAVLVLDHVALRQLDSRVERVPTILEVDASLDGAPVTLRSALAERDGALVLEASLATQGLDVARLAGIFGGESPLATGLLDGDWKLRLARPAPQRITVNGDGTLKVRDMSLALEARQLALAAVSWSGPLTAVLSTIAAPASLEAEGDLQVLGATLTGAAPGVNLGLDDMKWQGQLGYRPHDTRAALTHRGTLSLGRLTRAEGSRSLEADALRVDGTGEWALSAEDGAVGTFQGRAEVGTVSSTDPELSARAGNAGWDGTLTLAKAGIVTHEGKISLADLALTAGDLTAQDSGLAWDGRVTLSTTPEGGIETRAEGRLTNGRLTATMEPRQLEVVDLGWQGTAEAVHRESVLQPRLDGELSAGVIRVRDAAAGVTAEVTDTTMKGPISPLAPPGQAVVNGDITIGVLVVNALEAVTRLAHIQALRLTGLGVTLPGTVALKQASASGLELLPGATKDGKGTGQALVRLDDLALESLDNSRDADHFQLDAVRLTGLGVNVVRDKAGGLEGVQALTALSAGPAGEDGAGADATPAKTAPSGMTVAIGNLTLAGNNAVTFTDLGTRPTFHTTMVIDELSVAGLDTRPDSPPARVVFNATIDKYTGVDFTGTVDLVNTRPLVDVTGKVESLDLARLSTYTAKALGYTMTSGQLDADIDLKLKGSELDSTNQLKINKLEVEPLDAETMAALEAELSIPLEKALDMLRDGDDNISIKLPVTGDIDNPQFDASDAINQAIGSAIRAGAVSTLTLALQPFGTFIAIAQMVGDASSSVMLDPVDFEAGTLNWQGEAVAYTGKLAKLLKDKPDVRLKLCGIATSADAAALTAAAAAEVKEKPRAQKDESAPDTRAADEAKMNERLTALARQRAEKIKDRMISTLDAEPKRLFLCNPRIEKEEGAKPRVDVAL